MKYEVSFGRKIEVEASNEDEAIERAMNVIMQQVGNYPSSTLPNMLDARAKEIKEV